MSSERPTVRPVDTTADQDASATREPAVVHPTGTATQLPDYTDKRDESTEKTAFIIEGEEAPVDNFVLDPFQPFDDLPDEKHWVLSFRAIFIGIIAGALVNASNVYLGLKSGWTFTANLFGSILGFGIIKLCSKAFAENFPILGGSFGPRENNIVQTVATASGGLSNVFVSAFPALYQLKLLKTPQEDYWRIVSLTAVGGYFGFFFATPLRKFFIIYVARELRLIFPTASATAMTIRSMHHAVNGEAIGKLKMKFLLWAFSFALTLRVVSQYAIGLLWEWHFFAWFYIWGNYKNMAIHVENWGWFVQFTPAFIGSGMLVGLNVSISFFAGSVIAWGIIGPALVHNGIAFGKKIHPKDPHWHESVSFTSFGPPFSSKNTPSPRYWLLWPGVLAMIAISFTELLLQWKIILFAFQAMGRALSAATYDLALKAGKEIPFFKTKPQESQHLVEDPASPDEIPAWWWWGPGLLLAIIGMCAVLGAQYEMPIGMSLLSVFLAFFFSFLAIQCTGVTDITPLTAASKASQIVLGGASKGEHMPAQRALRLNLLGGALANMGANQATDLVADFRVGFLLRTPPNQQFLAQGLGTIVAVFFAPLIFILFMKAYPCIIKETEGCEFNYPSVAAWKATALAVTDPNFPIPRSSGIFAIIFSIFGCFMVLLRHFVWVGDRTWIRAYHPNMMCIALAFVLPQTYYGTAMVIGATWAHIWQKKNPARFELLGFAIAAGLIAGEGIGGVINAIIQIFNVAGSSDRKGHPGQTIGSNIACPKEC